MPWVQNFGHAVAIGVGTLVTMYLLSVMWFWFKARKFNNVEKISAEDLRERLATLSPDRLVVNRRCAQP